jgi:1,4-alpha-glucan branching enzyme
MSKKGKISLKSEVKEEKEVPQKTEKKVKFTLWAPEAMEVYLAGDFNLWSNKSLPMRKDKKGVWKTEIKLVPGHYEYKYFADNAWVENIPGAESISNSFGTQNFVMSVK